MIYTHRHKIRTRSQEPTGGTTKTTTNSYLLTSFRRERISDARIPVAHVPKTFGGPLGFIRMDINSPLPDSVKSATGKRKKGAVDENFIKDFIPEKRLGFGLDDLKHKCFMLDAVKKKWASTATPRKPNRLSARDKRKHKAFNIEPDGHKFEDFLPMHRLWEDYIRDVIDIKRFNSPDPNQSKDNKERLLKADYHGCYIVIKKSKNPNLVGMSGIVVMETKNLFKVIAKDNKIKCFPKQHSVFAFQLDGFLFTIHGTHFCVNPSQRSRRKFKQKATIDL